MNDAKLVREVPGFPGYHCHRNGQVIGRRGKILRPSVNRRGYAYYCMYRDGKPKGMKAHRIVAVTWVPNPKQLPQVNHKNGDKLDNRAENLEWVTNEQNFAHAAANDLIPRGESASRSKLTNEQVLRVAAMIMEGMADNPIAAELGIDSGTVWNIRHGRTWGHITGIEYSEPQGGVAPPRRGSKAHNATLTEAQVLDILEMLKQGVKGREIAARFGVTEHVVSRIKTGKTWRHMLDASEAK